MQDLNFCYKRSNFDQFLNKKWCPECCDCPDWCYNEREFIKENYPAGVDIIPPKKTPIAGVDSKKEGLCPEGTDWNDCVTQDRCCSKKMINNYKTKYGEDYKNCDVFTWKNTTPPQNMCRISLKSGVKWYFGQDGQWISSGGGSNNVCREPKKNSEGKIVTIGGVTMKPTGGKLTIKPNIFAANRTYCDANNKDRKQITTCH